MDVVFLWPPSGSLYEDDGGLWIARKVISRSNLILPYPIVYLSLFLLVIFSDQSSRVGHSLSNCLVAVSTQNWFLIWKNDLFIIKNCFAKYVRGLIKKSIVSFCDFLQPSRLRIAHSIFQSKIIIFEWKCFEERLNPIYRCLALWEFVLFLLLSCAANVWGCRSEKGLFFKNRIRLPKLTSSFCWNSALGEERKARREGGWSNILWPLKICSIFRYVARDISFCWRI